jgi:hypothetical protein
MMAADLIVSALYGQVLVSGIGSALVSETNQLSNERNCHNLWSAPEQASQA